MLDGGRRDFMRSGFLNCAPRKLLGGPSLGSYEDADASIAYAFASLLRHGVTTIVEAGNTGDVGDIMLQHMGACGARLYYSPAFVTGEYFVDSDGRLVVHRDEQLGFDGLERAIRFIEDHDGEFGDRYRGILNPDEFYLSTPELRRRTREPPTGSALASPCTSASNCLNFTRRSGWPVAPPSRCLPTKASSHRMCYSATAST